MDKQKDVIKEEDKVRDIVENLNAVKELRKTKESKMCKEQEEKKTIQRIIRAAELEVKKEIEAEKELTVEELKEKYLLNIENELLFRVITQDEDDGLKTFKIYVGGKVEGFGENCRIHNNFYTIFHRLFSYYTLLKDKS